MFNFGSSNKVLQAKIDQATQSYIELQGAIAKKEQDLNAKNLEIANQRQELQMEMSKKAHEADLRVMTAKADFEAEKSTWEAEKKSLEATLTKKAEMEKFELETTLKLKTDQQVAKANLDADKRVASLTTKHAEDISKMKSTHAVEIADVSKKANDDAYKRIKENLEDVTKHGTESSRTQKELMIALMEKMPRGGADINANLSMGNVPAIEAKEVTPSS